VSLLLSRRRSSAISVIVAGTLDSSRLGKPNRRAYRVYIQYVCVCVCVYIYIYIYIYIYMRACVYEYTKEKGNKKEREERGGMKRENSYSDTQKALRTPRARLDKLPNCTCIKV